MRLPYSDWGVNDNCDWVVSYAWCAFTFSKATEAVATHPVARVLDVLPQNHLYRIHFNVIDQRLLEV